jgi:uncharacterized membrane protein SirB2
MRQRHDAARGFKVRQVDYATLKTLHVSCAALSVTGFAARGVLMLRDSPLLGARWLRIAPHVVDTVLLASGVTLAWMSGQYPFARGWLTAKLLALVVYIVLGSVALKRGRSKVSRTVAFVLAMLAVLYIVSVAFTRNPLGPLAAV